MSGNMSLKIPNGIVGREVGGSFILLDLESGTYYQLDSVASRVWSIIEEADKVSIPDICETLLAEFEVSKNELETDIINLIDELKDKKILRPE